MSKRKHQVACTENARILRLFEVSCKCPCDTGLAKDAFQNLNLRPSLDVYRSICVTYKKSRNDLIYGVRLFLSHCPCLICDACAKVKLTDVYVTELRKLSQLFGSIPGWALLRIRCWVTNSRWAAPSLILSHEDNAKY